MESEGRKVLVFDDDILKAIEAVSFIAKKYSKVKETREELEIKVFGLSNSQKEFKRRRNGQLEANESLNKLIAEQQYTISKLVNVKNDIKIYHTETSKRDNRIKKLEEEIVEFTFKQNQEKLIEQDCQYLKEKNIKTQCEQGIQKLKDEKITVITEIACRTKELNKELLKAKAEKNEQTNALVLDYEEMLQRAYAQSMRIKDEMQELIKSSNTYVSVYLKRIEELEQAENKRVHIEPPNNVQSSSSSFFNSATNIMDGGDHISRDMHAISKAKKNNTNPSTQIGFYSLASKKE